MYHVPVMLSECMLGLRLSPAARVADLTFGGGGHSRAILERLGPEGRLIGFDQDPDAELIGRELERQDSRFTFVRGNFRFLTNYVHYHGLLGLDAVLADLGVSSHQFDLPDRGFSFRADATVDMRMNTAQSLTADAILSQYDEQALADILYLYGELKESRRLARAICGRRATIDRWTTALLADTVAPLLNPARRTKDMARLFQALRIEVNGEMKALSRMLAETAESITAGGRLVVMTYHSLEDRMVKNYMKTGSAEGRAEHDFYGRLTAPFTPVGKPQVPSEAEQQQNPRSRSAKLRIAERNE